MGISVAAFFVVLIVLGEVKRRRRALIAAAVVKDILKWCLRFPADQDNLWRLTQLGRHLLKAGVAQEVLSVSEAILLPLMSSGTAISSLQSGQIATLISYLAGNRHLNVGEFRGRVDSLLLAWLRHPLSDGEQPRPHLNLQRTSHVQRVADLVVSGLLNLEADRPALERFLRWVNNWEPQGKAKLRPMFGFLRRVHPASGL